MSLGIKTERKTKMELVGQKSLNNEAEKYKSSSQTTITRDHQAQEHEDDHGSKRGGWTTFPFIIGNLLGLSIAAGGWGANWIVFLITKYNIGSIAATKINNIGFGFVNLFPIVGAIIADTFTGNFTIISISSFVALIGMTMLTLIVGIHTLKPSPCEPGSPSCETPTKLQYLFLYTAMGLTTLGVGGSRFTIAAMGADQFDKTDHQGAFFNWYFVVMFVGNAISFVAIVYIQDNIGWGLGYGICLTAIAIGLAMILLGKPFYRFIKPKGSPFVSIVRAFVAAIRKRKVSRESLESSDYYYGTTVPKNDQSVPSKSFRFLNRAALKTEKDMQSDGSYSKSWNLCTVEEVEDLKTVMNILPLWSTGILLSITIAIVNSMSTVQALTMDRNLGSIKIPAGTFLAFSLLSTAISIFIIDRFFLPAWRKIIGRPMTLLQRIGVGHVINAIGMAVSALIEARRLHLARTEGLRHQPGSVVPMSALWLVVNLAILGLGEGFQFPGQVALYYQDFPESLKSTSTAMVSLLIGLGYYLSAAVMDFIDRITGWLPDNINEGHVDKVFWLCVVIAVANFGYYSVCAWLYYKNQRDQIADDRSDQLAPQFGLE